LLTLPLADAISQKLTYGYRLALTDSKYLSPTGRANPSGSWSLILQGNPLGIPYIYLPSTLKTICLH